jgi:hypothetical protein
MDDPGHEHDAITIEQVEYHAVVPDAEAKEGVGHALDRLHTLTADPAGFGHVGRKALEARSDALPCLGGQLRVCPSRRRPELNAIGLAQSSSERLTVRPRR